MISHEVGHHVQHLLGITTQMREKQQMARSKVEANRLSVRLELQADCFAGMWDALLPVKAVLMKRTY